MKKVAFVFNSRNNYILFNNMFFRWARCKFDDVLMFNIDIDSTLEQKNIGEMICNSHGMINLDMDKDSLKVAVIKTLEESFDYIEKNNLDIDWVFWWSHDNSIPKEDFIESFQKFVENEEINEKVGIIGFAVRDYEIPGEYHYGRALLVENGLEYPFNGSYQHLPESYLESDYFLVESTCFTSVAINRKLYRKYIKSDYDFKLYLWADDISFQFLQNNIASITIPSLEIIDGNRTKEMFGVNRAYDSLLQGKNYYHLDNNLDHHVYWKNKWGFDAYRKQSRQQIKDNIERYKGTLIEKIFNWDINCGPHTLKDI